MEGDTSCLACLFHSHHRCEAFVISTPSKPHRILFLSSLPLTLLLKHIATLLTTKMSSPSNKPAHPPPSPAPPQPPVEEATADEDALAMPTPANEESILADFDRFVLADYAISEPANARTAHSATSPADSLELLKRRYPSCDVDVLRDVLASCNNDERAALEFLGNAPESTVGDAQLAHRLQRRENQTALRHSRNDAVVSISRDVMEQMVSTLREIVVPALRAHFEELVLPDMCETSANVNYALREFQVSALLLPSENIVVKPSSDGASIRINIVNVVLELEVGRWSYESKGFVPVKDAGTARVTVHGLCVAIRLQPSRSHAGGNKLAIVDCEVTIDGVVRFKTRGAAADWAYNAMAVVLKPLVVSYIKEVIADTVKKALAVYLRQWSFPRSLDQDTVPAPPTTSSNQAPVTAE